MAAAPGRTIFNRSEIQTLGKSELISALLENDEDLLEAELTRKSNDELKRDLTKQSDQLLAEVRKKNEEVDGPEDDELDCDPLVSGDCAPKEPFEFFENDLAPPGQDRVITPAEMEVRELKAEISEANQYQKKQDVVFRQFVRGLLTENDEIVSNMREISDIEICIENELIKYYNHRVYVNDEGNLHRQVAVGTKEIDELPKLEDFSLLNKDVSTLNTTKDKCFGGRCVKTPVFKLGTGKGSTCITISKMESILTHVKEMANMEECQYLCEFFTREPPAIKMRSLQNIATAGVVPNELEKNNLPLQRVTRFLVLCLTNLDLKKLASCSESICAREMEEAIETQRIRQERHSNDERFYKETVVIMNSYLLFIQRFFSQSPKYVDMIDAYLKFVHSVRHQARNAKIDASIKQMVVDMSEEVELAIGMLIKVSIQSDPADTGDPVDTEPIDIFPVV